MAHAQKPDFVFRRNGRVHLNRQGRKFSRLLAAEVCASAVVMLDTPSSEVVWRVLATHSIRQFPLHFPSVRHRVPSRFKPRYYHFQTAVVFKAAGSKILSSAADRRQTAPKCWKYRTCNTVTHKTDVCILDIATCTNRLLIQN